MGDVTPSEKLGQEKGPDMNRALLPSGPFRRGGVPVRLCITIGTILACAATASARDFALGPITELHRGGNPTRLRAGEDLVVWQEHFDSSDERVRGYDLVAERVLEISLGGRNYFPDASGRTVVWSENGSQIKSYHVDTGAYAYLTTSPQNKTVPRIEGDVLVWEQWLDGYPKDVYLATGPGWQPVPVAGELGAWEGSPDINRGRIVYAYDNSSTGEHYLRVHDTQEQRITYERAGAVHAPDYPGISGNTIAWRTEGFSMRVARIDTGQEWGLSDAFQFALCEDCNDFVVFARYSDRSINVLDLRDGSITVLRSGYDFLADGPLALDGMRLFWCERPAGVSEMVVYTATIPEPATLSLLGLGGLALIRRRRRWCRRAGGASARRGNRLWFPRHGRHRPGSHQHRTARCLRFGGAGSREGQEEGSQIMNCASACNFCSILLPLLLAMWVRPAGADETVYDLSSGAWCAPTDMPIPRAQAIAVTDPTSGNIYVAGGYNGGAIYQTMDVYHPSSNSWSIAAPLPMYTRGASAAYANGRIFVFGGYTSDNLQSVQVYDIESDTWTLHPFPPGNWGSAAAYTGGKIWVTGGESDSASQTLAFDPDDLTWVVRANMPNQRLGHGVAAHGGYLYAFGGYQKDFRVPTATVDSYATQFDSWSTDPTDMLSGRFLFASGVTDGLVFVAGGTTVYHNYYPPFLNEFCVYDMRTDAWTCGPPLPEGLREAAGAVSGDVFYVFGGFDAQGISSQVWAIVPEPAVVWLMAVGGLALLRRSKGNEDTRNPGKCRRRMMDKTANPTSKRSCGACVLSVAAVLLLGSAAGAAGPTASCRSLGWLPGAYMETQVQAVSGDGNVAVGVSRLSIYDFAAFRWTEATGIVSLGVVKSLTPKDLSADGSVMAESDFLPGTGTPQAYRWTAQGGRVSLGILPGGRPGSSARGISPEGSVIVGSAAEGTYGHDEAYRWTESTGMVGLGDLWPEGIGYSAAYACSAAGGVVVGEVQSGYQSSRAFRWTQDGMVSLGCLPGHSTSCAQDVSADGLAIVGESEDASGSLEAFRWTVETGMAGLGHLPGHSRSRAMAVSGDGSVIVGDSAKADWSDCRAFVWTAEDGMRDLREVLAALGADMDGWALWRACDVSDNGLIIVGRGDRPGGISQESWIAVLPEPGALSLLALGALGVPGRRRQALPVCRQRQVGQVCPTHN